MPNVYRKYDSKSGVWADFGDLKARQDLGFVEDTDIATHTISAGQYVIWKGNLYTANSAITPDTALSSSNLTAVSNGGLNSVKNDVNNVRNYVDAVNGKFAGCTKISAAQIGNGSSVTFSNMADSVIFVNWYNSVGYSFANMIPIGFYGDWQVDCRAVFNINISKSGNNVIVRNNGDRIITATLLHPGV